MLNNRSHRSEKPTHHKQSSPHSTQLEKARPKQWRPRTAKNNQIILFPSFCLTTFSFPTFSPNWLWTKTSVYDFQGLPYAKHHTNITIFGVCLLQHYKPYSLSQFNYFIIVMKLLFDTKTCLFVSFFFHPGNHRSSKRFTLSCSHQKGLPNDSAGKESACDAGDTGDFNPCIRKTPWRRKRQPTPGILPGESHGQRSLAGYSPKGRKESDTTEWLSMPCVLSS